jgi:hypothetical protein
MLKSPLISVLKCLRNLYFNGIITTTSVKKYIFLFSYLSNKYLKKTKVDADLYVFLTDFSNDFGLAGVAWLGTLCGSKESRISISAYLYNDIYTAEVRVFSGFFLRLLECKVSPYAPS